MSDEAARTLAAALEKFGEDLVFAAVINAGWAPSQYEAFMAKRAEWSKAKGTK